MSARNPTPNALMDGSLWIDFCDQLRRVGEEVMRPEAPVDPVSRAEGFRYLTHVLRSALDVFVDHADPDFPVLYRVCDEIVKYGADNPDNYYQKCALSGAKTYRIRGQRGTIPYLSFLTQGTTFSEGDTMLPTGFLDSTDMQIEEDGTFEIIASVDERPGNWLPMQPQTQALLIRQTFQDRSTERIADLHIECLDAPSVRPAIDPEAFDRGLRSASQFLEGTAKLFCDWSERFQTHGNQLPPDDQALCQRVGGDPNIRYYNSYWELGEDQALVVEVSSIPECENWNLQLCNYWMESLDYRHHRIHVNKFTAEYEEDGSVRIVVAQRDPGLPNWLTTAGHPAGTMTFRWIGAKEYVDPVTRVVKLEELG